MSTDRFSQSQRIVFIVGAGRSGTTLLYKLLSLHPDAAFISNYDNRFQLSLTPYLQRLTRKRIHSKLAAWFGIGGNAYMPDRTIFRRFFPMPVEGQLLFAASGLDIDTMPDDVLDEKVALRLHSRLSDILEKSGGQRLVVKRTAINRQIPQVEQVFPKCRYVHLTRDGREVTHSLSKVAWWPEQRLWWDGRTPRAAEESGEHPLSICAKNWAMEVREIQHDLRQVDPARIHEVRYEDLMIDPPTTLGALLRFLGLEEQSAYADAVASLNLSARTPAWQRSWSEDEQAVVLDEIGDLLRELDYLP